MSNLSEHSAVAKIIRAELKKNNIACNVSAKSYSGGSSVRVYISDQLPATVDKIKSFCSSYQEGHFNAMEDIYEYSNSNSDLPQVKFVFVEHSFSDEIRIAAWSYCQARFSGLDRIVLDGVGFCHDARRHLSNVLNNDCEGFWTSRKPRG